MSITSPYFPVSKEYLSTTDLVESPPEVEPDLLEERPRDEDVHEEGRDKGDEHNFFPPIPQAHKHHLDQRIGT